MHGYAKTVTALTGGGRVRFWEPAGPPLTGPPLRGFSAGTTPFVSHPRIDGDRVRVGGADLDADAARRIRVVEEILALPHAVELCGRQNVDVVARTLCSACGEAKKDVALVTLERVEHGRIELAGLLPARCEVGSPGHRAYDAGNETGEQECTRAARPLPRRQTYAVAAPTRAATPRFGPNP